MSRFFGIIGIFVILAVAYGLSNNRKAINWRIVISGLILQSLLAVFVLKTFIGQWFFAKVGKVINLLLNFSDAGGDFVFGSLTKSSDMYAKLFGHPGMYLFALKIMPTIIFVAVLVSLAYYLGIMQKVVSFIAKIVYKIMRVSGAEALSNVASAFVGQIEAQIMIKPYVPTMTMSELMTSMTGSMACIAGGVMAVYIGMGVPAEYILAASIMAAPGAIVIAKIMYPETEESQTKGEVKLEVKNPYVNFIDAISHGASEGMKISINVIAMLIAFIALIAMINAGLGWTGNLIHSYFGIEKIFTISMTNLNLSSILGFLFSGFAYVMGVPFKEITTVGSLMGTKLVVNEFVAYIDLSTLMKQGVLSHKAIVIASFALCGFANFGSIAMQVGGIGELAPNRKADLAKLGMKALIAGTLASYMSATIAGILS